MRFRGPGGGTYAPFFIASTEGHILRPALERRGRPLPHRALHRGHSQGRSAVRRVHVEGPGPADRARELPPFHTACGIVDIMSHVFERYFTVVKKADFTDRLCEATMKAVIENGCIVMKEPRSYDARAEIMWAITASAWLRGCSVLRRPRLTAARCLSPGPSCRNDEAPSYIRRTGRQTGGTPSSSLCWSGTRGPLQRACAPSPSGP
jgi:hypothetical protein